MRFSDKVRIQRQKHQITQEQLAEYLSVSRQAVSKYESGRSYPEVRNIIKLSQLFRVSIDYLLNDNIEDNEEITS